MGIEQGQRNLTMRNLAAGVTDGARKSEPGTWMDKRSGARGHLESWSASKEINNKTERLESLI